MAMAFNATSGRNGNPNFNPNAVIENAKGGSGQDTIFGNEADNYLYGGGDGDTLFGEGGDDTLDGGAGDDWMYGGPSDDTYVVDSPGDHVSELEMTAAVRKWTHGGNDTVISMIDNYTLPQCVENLTLFYGVNGTGNELANVLTGNGFANILDGGAGDDSLYGNEGADTLIGGAGADTLDGGIGNDKLIIDNGDDAGGDVAIGGNNWDTVQADASVAAKGLRLNLFAAGTPITAEVNLVPGTSAAIGVEDVIGSTGNDWIDASRFDGDFAGSSATRATTQSKAAQMCSLTEATTRHHRACGRVIKLRYRARAAGQFHGTQLVFDHRSRHRPDQLRARRRDRKVRSRRCNIELRHPQLDGSELRRDRVLGRNHHRWHPHGHGDLCRLAFCSPCRSPRAGGGWAQAQSSTHEQEHLVSIEYVIGSNFNDNFFGSPNGDVFEGGDGNDYIYGDGGPDTLLGGAGNDTVSYNDGEAQVDGGDGYDILLADESTDATGIHFKVLGSHFEYVGGRFGNDVIDALVSTTASRSVPTAGMTSSTVETASTCSMVTKALTRSWSAAGGRTTASLPTPAATGGPSPTRPPEFMICFGMSRRFSSTTAASGSGAVWNKSQQRLHGRHPVPQRHSGDTWFAAISNGAFRRLASGRRLRQPLLRCRGRRLRRQRHLRHPLSQQRDRRHLVRGDHRNGAFAGWQQIGGSDTQLFRRRRRRLLGNGTSGHPVTATTRPATPGSRRSATALLRAGIRSAAPIPITPWPGSAISTATAPTTSCFGTTPTGDIWYEAMNDGAFAGWHQIGGSDTSYCGGSASAIIYGNGTVGHPVAEQHDGRHLVRGDEQRQLRRLASGRRQRPKLPGEDVTLSRQAKLHVQGVGPTPAILRRK